MGAGPARKPKGHLYASLVAGHVRRFMMRRNHLGAQIKNSINIEQRREQTERAENLF